MVKTEESFTKTGYGEVGLTVACAHRDGCTPSSSSCGGGGGAFLFLRVPHAVSPTEYVCNSRGCENAFY